MPTGQRDWEIRVHELPDYEFVYDDAEEQLSENACGNPHNVHGHACEAPDVVGGMIKIRRNGKYGFCDRYGKIVIPCVYDQAGQFESGLCIVGIAGNYGLVDRQGQVILPLLHQTLNKSYEVLNAERVFVLPEKYLLDLDGAAEESGFPRYLYTGESPRCLLEFDALSDYRPETFWKDSDKLLVGIGGRYGIVDSRGRVCAPLIYDLIHRHGIASRDGQSALLDADGREVLPAAYERIRKLSIRKTISGEYRGDFILAGKKGEADHVFTKNGLLLCAMPRRRFTGRDVIARIMESCFAGRLDENHCLMRAEGKYGVIQSGGLNGFEQDGQTRRGLAEILPFIWDDPKACAEEYWKRLDLDARQTRSI